MYPPSPQNHTTDTPASPTRPRVFGLGLFAVLVPGRFEIVLGPRHRIQGYPHGGIQRGRHRRHHRGLLGGAGGHPLGRSDRHVRGVQGQGAVLREPLHNHNYWCRLSTLAVGAVTFS